MKRGRRTILTIVVTFVVSVGIAVILGLVVVFSGVVNVAATTPDLPIVAWVLNTTMEHSVEAHARDVVVPADYSKPDIEVGRKHYGDICELCHGAPGVEPEWPGQGLQPYPPDLTRTADDWTPAEVFWIISNGIKMTGMPAAGPSHSDSEIWDLTAFVKSLPSMTPEQYGIRGQSAGSEPAEQNQPKGESGQ